MHGHGWVVVLGGGDGTRLRSLTTGPDGTLVPKQFCAFAGRSTLMADALARARRLVPRDRIVPVLTERHRKWWAAEVAGIPSDHLVVQPGNRGTASGMLLPVLHVFARDPAAVLVVLPSDHAFRDERRVVAALESAMLQAALRPDRLVLLGMEADSPQTDYGWILPCSDARDGCANIHSFVEKPTRQRALELLNAGALWSTFMMAGTAQAFLDMHHAATPALLHAFLDAARSGPLVVDGEPSAGLRNLHERLAPSDFSRDVLSREEVRERLAVMRVPRCGWSDLGTPERVAAWMGAAAAVGGQA